MGTLAQEMLRAGHLLILLIGLVLWFIERHRAQRIAGREREQRRIVTGRPIELALLPVPLWVHMDTVLVQMVFDNLLDNAIKYAQAWFG